MNGGHLYRLLSYPVWRPVYLDISTFTIMPEEFACDITVGAIDLDDTLLYNDLKNQFPCPEADRLCLAWGSF